MTHQANSKFTSSDDFVLDTESEAFTRDPYPTYAWLRENAPVYYWPQKDTVVLSRFDDLRSFFVGDHLSTNIHDWEHHPGMGIYEQPGFEGFAKIHRNSFFNIPQADHARIRKLTSVALTPRAVRRMKQHIVDIVDRNLDELIASGDEVVNLRPFADAIPLAVICDLIGVPEELRKDFRVAGQAVLRSIQPTNSPEELAATAVNLNGAVALVEKMLTDRRADPNPPDDLLTDFIQANEDGDRLSDDELVMIIFGLITAGSDTTVHAICYATRSLLLHPEALAELQADRSLLRSAAEETLRWDSFGKVGLFHYAREDMEMGGVPVRKGQAVAVAMGAAFRDDKAYERADEFDIHRDYSGSLVFGLGRHFCLGANLARAELMQAIETLLLDRFPAAKLAGDVEFDVSNPVMRPMTNLPIRLGPDHGKKTEASA
ncbi:cytochrome P450 [Pseudenhygromyxa sp. WMMC2535]|uniref:cytochrome P450 n=1 Tax=Pseudenhygromyxa sp. WMMC2535 TaxID=2712867 RepID=UPI0015579FAE|nr:cytochrome P450 [Pseudenhygromyxa sp. WMMC2535]NVB38152.1 cytochrome P450 [Pseudenhygromyxa sp. WMMC2535]